MSKKADRLSIIATITSAAYRFKNKMVGRTFMYVFDDKYIEVLYRTKDFMHMTGVGSKSSAEQFYKDAIKGRLKADHIFFDKRHPYDLCLKKVSQIVNLSAVVESDLLVFEDLKTKTFSYKFSLSELNFTVCLTKDVNANNEILSDVYVVRSFRVEDSFDKAENVYEVQCIFEKKNDEKLYDKMNYKAEKINIMDLPEAVLDKLEDSIKALD